MPSVCIVIPPRLVSEKNCKEIYRGEDEATWILEVEEQAKSSFVYEQRFDDDKEACPQFEPDIAEFGIGYFISEEPKQCIALT